MTVATTVTPVAEPTAHAPAEPQAPTGLMPVRDRLRARVRLLRAVAALLEVIADEAPGLPDAAAVAPKHELGLAEPDHVLFPALIRAALGLHEPHAGRSSAKTVLVRGLADLAGGPARLGEPLTWSETRVLCYLPTHMSVRGIAAELCLSANTVKTHLRHVYRKLGAHNRHEAVQRARAIGLLAASSRRRWNAGPPHHMNGEGDMAYGHAERNLALLRRLEAETRQLLENLDQPDPEQSAWLQEVTSRGDDR